MSKCQQHLHYIVNVHTGRGHSACPSDEDIFDLWKYALGWNYKFCKYDMTKARFIWNCYILWDRL